MIHKKTSKPAFVADLLVKIIKYLYGRDVDTLICGVFVMFKITHFHLVEATGIEPVSENPSI